MALCDEETKEISKQVMDLYDKAWKLEKESMSLGINKKKPKSDIFLSREIIDLLISLQDDFNNDGSTISPKLKQKKLNLIEKYIFKLKTNGHIEMLSDFRNRNVILLLISIPCKQTLKCLNVLINLGCNINSIDNRGQNGYHIACEYTNYSVIKLLYKYNVDITLKDKSIEQLTPLHIALDILISNENNNNSINTFKYFKIAKLCTEYAFLQGQDFKNDKLRKDNGSSWNFQKGQSILDIANQHFIVLNVLHDAYLNCKNLRKEFKKQILKHNKQFNETLVELIWSFMYSKLPKLGLATKLKKAKEKIAKDRLERRESMRNSIKGKNVKSNASGKKRKKKKKTKAETTTEKSNK